MSLFSKTQLTITPRFVLYTNYSCNQQCVFCYYLDKVKQKKLLPPWKAKIFIWVAYRLGKRAIDFSGGEPTLHPNLMEMIAYAKKCGYTTICIITNGFKTAQEKYLLQLKSAGLNDILISLHSHSQKTHELLTQKPESFAQAIKSIQNSQKHLIPVRTNIVVNEHNYLQLGSYCALLKKLRVRTINLLVINPASFPLRNKSSVLKNGPMYEIFGKCISNSLDLYEKYFEKINVRFMPFCYLKKHPDNIRNVWQKIHEPEEWDPLLSFLFTKFGIIATIKAIVQGFLINEDIPQYQTKNILQYISKTLNKAKVKNNYAKNELCLKSCSLSPICDGIPIDFIKTFGPPKVFPIQIKNKKNIYAPLYFLKPKHNA